MGLALPGIFSGIDTETIVSQLMEINRRPLYQLQDREALWQARQSAVSEIESRLSSLKSLLSGMRNGESLRSVTATSGNTAVLTATASSGAAEGSHQIIVDRLATAHKLVHTSGLAGLDSQVGAEKSTALNAHGIDDPSKQVTWFTTGANGATYTFDFGDEADIDNVVFDPSSDYGMNEVRDLINVRSQAVAGYDAASVEFDSQTNLYYLRLTAKESATTGGMTQTLTAGDAIDQIHDDDDWNKAAAGAGKLVYTYNGTTRTVYVTDATTLEGLRDRINNDGANPGVNASILEYNDTYHLVLSGRNTGADYAITVDDFQTTLNGFDTGDFTETQQGLDARIRVDGYPPDPDWIERSSNTITDVIPGVTLNLVGTSAQAVNVTLTRSTVSLKNALYSFVATYNELVSQIDTYTGYDEATGTAGLLQGDATLSGVIARIREALVTAAPGFLDGEDAYTLPVQIGLKLDRYGTLSIVNASTDTDTSLDDALSADYLGVLSLIGAVRTGASDDDYVQFVSAAESTLAGFYDVEVDFYADGSIQAARIKGADESEWRSMDVDGNTLLGAAGNPEVGLELTAVSDGTPGEHTQSAQVRVRQGFAGALYDILQDVLDATDGAVTLKKGALQQTIEEIDRKIETQQQRLEAQEQRLREQYARLEAILARFDAQRGAFEAMFMQLEAMNSYRQ
ncbi:MAG: hypothetical protein AMJ81_00475 [Phycisphaerae bacterium SM23_33]|nr:MAG: hypothetical protein AMJ81_00475 [Phycisphaerae bacterium SM23_33]